MDKDAYVKAAFKESEIYENISLKKYWTKFIRNICVGFSKLIWILTPRKSFKKGKWEGQLKIKKADVLSFTL